MRAALSSFDLRENCRCTCQALRALDRAFVPRAEKEGPRSVISCVRRTYLGGLLWFCSWAVRKHAGIVRRTRCAPALALDRDSLSGGCIRPSTLRWCIREMLSALEKRRSASNLSVVPPSRACFPSTQRWPSHRVLAGLNARVSQSSPAAT